MRSTRSSSLRRRIDWLARGSFTSFSRRTSIRTSFGGRELYASDFEKAAALFHSLIKSLPFMDGTRRTAFVATLFFLDHCGYSLPKRFPLDRVIDFCVSVAEENLRQSRGEDISPRTISEIARWFQELLAGSN